MPDVVGFLNSQLADLCNSAIVTHRLAGLAVGVVREDYLAWSASFGFADIDRRQKANDRTLARVASVTKTFTALSIMQLRDEDRLALEDPLVLHIPEFSSVVPTAGRVEDVTIRRLLTHRSGIPTEPPLPGWDALSFPAMEAIIASLPSVEVVIPQDSAWKYSNFAFALLGEVVARLTGRPYEQYVQDNILDPLGMSDTTFGIDDRVRSLLATGYLPAEFEEHPQRAPYAHMNGMSAAGQLQSNVRDLARWVSLQFRVEGGKRSGTQILDGRSLEEMHRPVYIEPDWSAGQALAWRVVRVGDHVYHNHGGGIHGFATSVMFHKPSKTGAIVLGNLWPSTASHQIARDILELIVGKTEEQQRSAAKPPPAAPQKTPDHMAEYLGRYRAAPGVPAVIVYREGNLKIAEPPPGQYTLHGGGLLELTDRKDVFLVRGGRGSGEKAIFKRDAAGRLASFELGGFVYHR